MLQSYHREKAKEQSKNSGSDTGTQFLASLTQNLHSLPPDSTGKPVTVPNHSADESALTIVPPKWQRRERTTLPTRRSTLLFSCGIRLQKVRPINNREKTTHKKIQAGMNIHSVQARLNLKTAPSAEHPV